MCAARNKNLIRFNTLVSYKKFGNSRALLLISAVLTQHSQSVSPQIVSISAGEQRCHSVDSAWVLAESGVRRILLSTDGRPIASGSDQFWFLICAEIRTPEKAGSKEGRKQKIRTDTTSSSACIVSARSQAISGIFRFTRLRWRQRQSKKKSSITYSNVPPPHALAFECVRVCVCMGRHDVHTSKTTRQKAHAHFMLLMFVSIQIASR